jgi:hypothetical protein
LGEASYISNLKSEERLSKKEYNRLEATIYFKGIKDYFEREIPIIKDFKFSHNALFASFQDIDPSTIRLLVDGKEIPYTYDFNGLTAPFMRKNGRHTASISARNRKGNITKPHIIEFFIDNPPEDIYIHFYPALLPKKGKLPISIIVDIVDIQGNPVSDNKLVRFKTNAGTLSLDSCLTRGGGVNNSLLLKERTRSVYLVAECEELKVRKEINIKTTEKSLLTGIIHSEGQPIEGVIVKVKKSTAVTNENGRYYLFLQPGKTTLTVKKRGFYEIKKECDILDGTGMNLDIELKPIFNGLLFGKKIIIDPRDLSFLTLDVARHIRDWLYISGADSLLSRNSIYEKMGEVERTRFVISQNPDRLISVSHYNKYQKYGSRCYYYYTDKESKKFANTIQRYIVNYLKRPDLGVGESSSYMIIHPHCRRTLVVPGNLSNNKFRDKLECYSYRIKEAYLIFCGILEDMGLQSKPMGSLMGKIVDKDNRPIDNVSILVSNGQSLITEKDGKFHFLYLDPGDTKVLFSKDGKTTERDVTIKSGETHNMEAIL